MRGRLLACLAFAALSACATAPPQPQISSVRFGAVVLPRGVERSNLDLAEDFLDLTFELESGEKLKHLLKYETPVRVYLASPALAEYRPDLDRAPRAAARRGRDRHLRDRAIRGARISSSRRCRRRRSPRSFRPRPVSSCRARPTGAGSCGASPRHGCAGPTRTTLERAAIFLPLDTTPQDVRDCLSEEITQALGPADDLYRLPDSIWNDDNFHGMATPFDMTMLRALYQPEFRSGMTREEAAALVPGVLNRVNPKGRGLPRQPRNPKSRAWAGAIEEALTRDAPRNKRLAAATIASADRGGDAPGGSPTRGFATDARAAEHPARSGCGGARFRAGL